ncbi:MAG: cell division protein FtsK, partial [Planctomycetota bacterium]
YKLAPETPPDEQRLTDLMHEIGSAAKDSLRVVVPFDAVRPAQDEIWSRSAVDEVAVSLGRSGAVRLQAFRVGAGLSQHALIAGKTGSGKSTLLHVLITNLALWYSPDEIEMYLIDFKQGVEFKSYVSHHLPHARAIAIESDREFGLSVLQRIQAEMKRRGELFRDAQVQDIAAYRAAAGGVLPRVLLIVDEFQVFFAEDDRLAQDAGVLLDQLVRQGRAFGIHVVLGSQSLAGNIALARSTLGQMAVRIALQCPEADAQLILDDTNTAARLLTRPGEAIYNDAGGLVEGNHPFQTAWLPDSQRSELLAPLPQLARQRRLHLSPTVVFEGNRPADLRENPLLAEALRAPPDDGRPPRAWLGAPVAIKDPSSVLLRPQPGANLLIVGQQDRSAMAVMHAALLSIAAQRSPEAARFVLLDGTPEDRASDSLFAAFEATAPQRVERVAYRDVARAIAELSSLVSERLERDEHDGPLIVLAIYALQRFRALRRSEDDFSFSDDDRPRPDKDLAAVLRDGPSVGVHVLAWCDTLANVERTLERGVLGEFDNRLLFQMSAADSSNLIDSPEANRLGPNRALLYSEERGLMEKLRPYAAPNADWLKSAGQALRRRARRA